jgi:hypothetical protein
MCCTCTCGGLHNRRSIPTRGSITARPQCCNIQKTKTQNNISYWVDGGGCPNLRAFFKMIMMHCNVSRWLKDVESVKNVYFAVAGSEFHVLQWIWNHCINHLSMYIILQISVISTCAFLTKNMLKWTLTGDRAVLILSVQADSVSQVVSTYALLGWILSLTKAI